MPLFLIQLPLLLKRSEVEFAEYINERRKNESASEKKDAEGALDDGVDNASSRARQQPRNAAKLSLAEKRKDAKTFEDNAGIQQLRDFLNNCGEIRTYSWLEDDEIGTVVITFAVDAANSDMVVGALSKLSLCDEYGASINVLTTEIQLPKQTTNDEVRRKHEEILKSRIAVAQVAAQAEIQVRQRRSESLFVRDSHCVGVV